MSAEIYNNFDVKKASHIDQRLISVASYSNLPNTALLTNFLYVGALVYVQDEETFYKLDSTSTWVKLVDNAAGVGVINVAGNNSTSILDLSLVSPAIETCDTVLINISNGNSLNIQTILNFPADKKITFQVETGKSVTFNHVDYDLASTDQIVFEDGFNMTINGRNVGNESVTFKKNSVAIVQHSAVQFMKSAEWAQNILSIAITDGLNSTSTTSALSANQGRVLENLIEGKETAFLKGTGLSYDSTSNTLNVDAWDWTRFNNPAGSVNLSTVSDFENYLTSLSNVIAPETHRYIVVNNTINDRGIWLIPASADPSNFSNWVMLSEGNPISFHRVMNIFSSATPGSNLTGNNYHPAATLNTAIGDDVPNFVSNSDGDLGNKVSFAFNQVGLYKIEAEVPLIGTDQSSFDEISKAVLNLVITDGVQSAANPTNTGFIADADAYQHVHIATSGVREIKARVSTTLKIDSVGVDSGFTLAISDTSGSAITWTNISVGTYGKLKITKIR